MCQFLQIQSHIATTLSICYISVCKETRIFPYSTYLLSSSYEQLCTLYVVAMHGLGYVYIPPQYFLDHTEVFHCDYVRS